jgi:nicotinamide-nucleotide amidase
LLDRELEVDEEALEAIRRKCEERGLAFSEARQRQALVVSGAEVLPNSVGAAPGERLEVGSSVLFMLPGPPDEFHAVLHEQIVPRLQKQEEVRAGHIFMVCGLAEADMIERFEEKKFPPAGVNVAFCAAPGRIEVRLSAETEETIGTAVTAARAILGATVFAEARRTMEEVVGALLSDRNETLAVAESCTGGLLGHRLTNVSGSSNYFMGGVLAYSNESKCRDLGVEESTLQAVGAVSTEVAQQMAAGVRDRFDSTYGLGITGIAGPSGGTEEKPVGLVYIGLSSPDGTVTRRFTFGGGRARVKQWSSQMALNMLRLKLAGALEKDA